MDLFSKYKKEGWDFFDNYRCRIKVGTLVGGKPKNPELIEAWVNAKCKDKTEAERKRIRDAHVDTLDDEVDGQREKSAIGFARVDGQLAIEGRQVKAMLKEAANIIKDKLPIKDGKISSLKSKVADQVFVVEEWIKLGRTDPDDVDERPIHVMTRQGPRDSLKVCEILRDVEIEFTVRRLSASGKSSVPEKVLMAILDYAQSIGLGADRSQGAGVFEVLSVEKIEG